MVAVSFFSSFLSSLRTGAATNPRPSTQQSNVSFIFDQWHEAPELSREMEHRHGACATSGYLIRCGNSAGCKPAGRKTASLGCGGAQDSHFDIRHSAFVISHDIPAASLHAAYSAAAIEFRSHLPGRREWS